MRYRFLVLISCFLGSFLAGNLPEVAHAGVPCSVPFNLTNGTPADATQVMANYNAILTCLSTSAAANGANSDITALNGLTTPITPAQGGAQALCGASGFAVTNNGGSPTTQLNITWTQALVTSTLNAVQFGTGATVTLNFATSGAANGLDTGSLAASTFYYIWLIGNGSTIASLASLSSSAPTLPAGYTFKCRVGVWESNTLSQLLVMATVGRRTQLLQLATTNITANALLITSSTGTCTTATAFALTTFAGIPPTATRAIGMVGFNSNTEAYVSSFQGPLSNAQFALGETVPTGTSISVQFDLVLPSAQQLYTCITGAGGGVVNVSGWEDAVNAN